MRLAHPDLFAGVVVISGLPAKYVPRYLPHHERLPLFFVLGDWPPRPTRCIFGNYVKPLIVKTWDVTYVEYHRRGLEDFPEEIPTAFDWMDRHRRDPVPKSFKVVHGPHLRRPVLRRRGPRVRRRAGPRRPEAVEMLGQNLNPAESEDETSSLQQPDSS